MEKYYNGTKLLSLKDVNGNTPEIILCTTNRTAGKTTYFSRYFVNRFLKYGEKFILLYRFNYELDSISDKFFKCIGELFFEEKIMSAEKRAKGVYCELFLAERSNPDEKSCCGYAIALNSADQIKKYSHYFSDAVRILFDEFQSETNKYCDNEIEKFLSIHTSLARGHGEQVKYLPVFMLSNAVSLINPYFVALGISNRLKQDTKFLRGNGYVLENGFNPSAATAQKTSLFNQAFSGCKYLDYSSQNVYLNDSTAFIEKPAGKSRYIVTLKYNNKIYSIREFPETGVLYCDNSFDETFPQKISITTADHDINYVMLKNNALLIQNMRYYFEHGCFRFKDLQCKEVILKLVQYI